MMILKQSQIKDEVLVCPYCMCDAGCKLGCCGESCAHFEMAYITSDDECYLVREVEIEE